MEPAYACTFPHYIHCTEAFIHTMYGIKSRNACFCNIQTYRKMKNNSKFDIRISSFCNNSKNYVQSEAKQRPCYIQNKKDPIYSKKNNQQQYLCSSRIKIKAHFTSHHRHIQKKTNNIFIGKILLPLVVLLLHYIRHWSYYEYPYTAIQKHTRSSLRQPFTAS